MQNIRNIIFDLGGVIINLDMHATREAFVALGIKNFDSLYSQASQSGVFDSFDKGLITPQEFRTYLRTHIPGKASDEQIDDAWNAMLKDVPKYRLDILTRLSRHYRLFLLSNTNKIHVDCFSRELERVHGTKDFSPYFERCYYSCAIGMRKPDEEVFRFVLAENNLNPSETLFIDDSVQHIQGADKAGIRSALLQSETLPGLLERLKLSL